MSSEPESQPLAADSADAPAEEKSFSDEWWIVPQTEEERAALRERNMEAFRIKYTTVYDAFVDFQPKSKLVFDDDGQPDMEFAGALFYDGNVEEFTRNQLSRYWKNPSRLALSPPMPQYLDQHTGQFLYKLLDRLKNDLGVEFSIGRTDKTSFYTIVIGLGLGRHLPEVIERTGCRNLFILEPNLEGFYHSLELLDWRAIMLEMEARNGDLFFFITGTPQDWMDALRSRVRASNTVSFDGLHIYHHYNNSLFSDFTKKFNSEAQLLLSGLGFFFDELLMLRNTYDNLNKPGCRIFKRVSADVVETTPAIIVGCGPSLDQNIEDIKRNADKAVIFSCGSALGPLMDAGITPDFQLELENYDVVRVLSYASEKYDLSDICLVASSTVDLDVKNHFNDVVYYFRGALSPYPVFSNAEDSCLRHLDPTVVNVGLSFAQEVGFREFYFFGTDLGQKDSSLHHAKSSFHYSSKAKDEMLQEFNKEMPGNFGGKAMTSWGLFWALDTVQRAIAQAGPRHKYFNCSNGVRIEGAIPKLSRTLDLPEPSMSREDTVRDIKEKFPVFGEEDFAEHWQPEKMIAAIDDLADILVALFETHDLIKGTDHLIELAQLFYGDTDDVFDQYARLLFRGSMNMAMNANDYYLARITDDSVIEQANEIDRELLVALTERLRRDSIIHIRALDKGIALSEKFLRGDIEDPGLSEDEEKLLAAVG